MIQLDNKKKIFIIVVLILIIIILFFVVKLFRGRSVNQIVKPSVVTSGQIKNQPARIMTNDEKIHEIGINPSQEAEVLNDQNGLYSYRIKK